MMELAKIGRWLGGNTPWALTLRKWKNLISMVKGFSIRLSPIDDELKHKTNL